MKQIISSECQCHALRACIVFIRIHVHTEVYNKYVICTVECTFHVTIDVATKFESSLPIVCRDIPRAFCEFYFSLCGDYDLIHYLITYVKNLNISRTR